jgi:hypothetical protein
MSRNNYTRFVLLLLFVLVTGCSAQKVLTISEVIQNAERLDGKMIRVRGFAYLWINPSQAQMWGMGGCVPKTDPSYGQGVAIGWLTLYDSVFPDTWGGDHAPRDEIGVRISESAFGCNGDFCKITCSPFEVVSGRTYELVGTLQVHENSDLILENIDVEGSSQLVDGEWIPISARNFDVLFP